MEDYSEFLESAIEIADRAGKVALSYFRHSILIELKENQTPVTIADRKTEEKIRSELLQFFPGHRIIGEEFENVPSQSEYVWTIDPIDGTRSFIRGIPLFGTLVGLLHRGEPVVGVVVLPALHEIYSAAKGLGAYCNGTQIHVSSNRILESSVISCGDTSCFETSGKSALLDAIHTEAELSRTYTDCFGHTLVARGAVDAMVDPLVSIWDVAPIACLVKEAGGEYFSLDGRETVGDTSFVTCTPALKEQLLALPQGPKPRAARRS